MHPHERSDLRHHPTQIPATFSDATKHARFIELIDLTKIEAEMRELQVLLAPRDGDVVLCHNDLLCKNIIFDEAGEGRPDTGSSC